MESNPYTKLLTLIRDYYFVNYADDDPMLLGRMPNEQEPAETGRLLSAIVAELLKLEGQGYLHKAVGFLYDMGVNVDQDLITFVDFDYFHNYEEALRGQQQQYCFHDPIAGLHELHSLNPPYGAAWFTNPAFIWAGQHKVADVNSFIEDHKLPPYYHDWPKDMQMLLRLQFG